MHACSKREGLKENSNRTKLNEEPKPVYNPKPVSVATTDSPTVRPRGEATGGGEQRRRRRHNKTEKKKEKESEELLGDGLQSSALFFGAWS